MLRRITLSGFRSYSTEQTIEFPKTPGLYLMRGVNEVDTALAGNDTGKSTLWDAIFWGLYGETTRGLRAGQIVSWGESTAMVEQEWDVSGGKVITIQRSQSPNSLLLNGDPVEQTDIDDAVGLNKDEFLHSVLVGQFNPYFLDLSATAKLEMLGGVLGLNYWEEKSTEASVWAKKSEGLVDGLLGKLQMVHGTIEALRKQKKDTIQRMEEWVLRSETEATEKKRELSKLLRCELMLESRVKELSLRQEVAFVRCRKRVSNWQQFIDEQSSLTMTIDSLQGDLKLDRCPFCKRSLGDQWRVKLKEQLKDVLTRQQNNIEGFEVARTAKDKAAFRLNEIERELRGFSSELADIRGQIKAKRLMDEVEANP